jgi:pimeloyl-ACP methyl ester carboxylesterase
MRGRQWAAALACLVLAGTVATGQPAGEKQADKKGVEGVWEGSLKVGPMELRLVFHITQKDGKRTATMDSLDQGAKGIPIDTVDLKEGILKLELKKLKASYEGKLKPDGSAVDGMWKQGPVDLPLTLKRVEKATEVKRPQLPKKPYPYDEEEVSYENPKAGLKFFGTLTRPRGNGPFPAVLLIPGSGSHDRDETIFGHKPFLVLADHLTRKGVAVLRVDDRGVGKSTGNKMKSTSAELAGDAVAAVAYLKSRPDIDAKHIGVMGHSEGGIIGPLAASQCPDIAFVVMLAGTGLPGEEILYLQGQAVLKATGASAQQLETQRTVQQAIFRIVKEEKDDAKAKPLIKERLDELIAKMSEKEKKEQEQLKKMGEAQMTMVFTPWFRFFLTYDPRPALGKLKVPVLAIIGDKDLQVPSKENIKAITDALREGGNKDFTVKELPNLNHLFQTCKTGAISEYNRIEETFAPAALDLISDWILQRVKANH